MKVSLKWLGEFFPTLGGGHEVLNKAELIREKLPLAGLEVGQTKQLGDGIESIIVAQIESFEKHPQADRLNVCQVNTGDKVLQIVCGAPNVKAGVKVALAQIGVVLPGGLKIKQAAIRGVESNGMLCSEKELGLSDESAGILHLPDSAPLGTSLVKALGLNDQIWEIELTPDRADCLSHFGVAREIGRILGVKPALPDFDMLNASDSSDVPLLSVEVQAAKACPIYGAQLFEGLANRSSPEWMRRLLEALGHRSHNSLVDITNYVLMELGHPLHAFDADKIAGSKILVRFAKAGEKLKTLDGEIRTLSADDLVIADLEKPMALAGLMGGFDSGVSATTTRVVLESAVFDSAVIRAMSQRHKIHSEASHRFERGVDAAGGARAAGRASLLMRQLTGGRRRGSYVELRSPVGEKALHKFSLNFDMRAVKLVVGIESSGEEITRALSSVGIEAQAKSTNVLRVDVPTYRLDLAREIDLVEEIARLLGYDRIPLRYPPQEAATQSLTTPLFEKLRQIRHRLLETGLTEMMPYSFISNDEKKWLAGGIKLVELQNPLSNDWLYMRPNLFFGLAKVLSRHAALGQLRGAFFDIGSVFEEVASAKAAAPGKKNAIAGEKTLGDKAAGEKAVSDKETYSKDPSISERSTGVRESYHASWALIGQRSDEHWSTDKKASDRRAHVDFFDAKGIGESLVTGLSALEPRWAGTQYVSLASVDTAEIERQAPWIPLGLLHPVRTALLVWPGKPPGQIVGVVGELHPEHKTTLLNLPTGLQLGAVYGEIRAIPDLWAESSLSEAQGVVPRGKIQVSRKFPVVERDLALVVKADIKASDLDQNLRRSAGPALIDLKCVDLFRMPDGRNSLAYRIQLQGESTTLTDEEIGGILKKMLEAASTKFGAELRG